MKASRKTVPVTSRALSQRIARELAKKDQRLVKLRGRAADELGEYVIIEGPYVRRANVKLDVLGRELGLLEPWERLER